MSGPTPILPVILCGGAGTRLWPVSTEAAPKPFQPLFSGQTLFQAAVRRVRDESAGFLAPLIVCGRAHRALAEAQLAEIGVEAEALVLEPVGRGTAPIAAIAAELAAKRHPGARILMMPADHLITDEMAFRAAVTGAVDAASDRIVTFGVRPTRPETGYGYIEAGEVLDGGVREITRFIEKPDAARAAEFMRAGRYLWNAGIFLFSPARLSAELKALRPDIAEGALNALPTYSAGAIVELDEARFHACAAESIDRAVMEHTRHGAVVGLESDWADVGAWDEVWRLSAKDENGNVSHGRVAAIGSNDCLLWTDGAPIAAVGLSGMIVVATQTGVLAVPRERAQDVRAAAEALTPGREPG